MSEFEKMQSGDWYRCVDPELDRFREVAADAAYEHNSLPPRERGDMGPKLRALLRAGGACRIEAPFHCAYGFNIRMGGKVFFNAGCVILDTAPVSIGDATMFGPGVHIYCADHHHDPLLRADGLERGLPVTIGKNVWIGVGAGEKVAGNPARVLNFKSRV